MSVVAILATIVVLLWNYIATSSLLSENNKTVIEGVKKELLDLEYEKSWSKENFEKLTKLQQEQIALVLEQYEGQKWNNPSNNNENAAQPNNEAWKILPPGQLAKIMQWSYIKWDINAKISWIEYSDLECPFCKRFHTNGTLEQVMGKYWTKVNYVFKHFPLWFHKNAQKEHEAAECVWEIWWSDKYYEYIDEVFKQTNSNWEWFALDKLQPLAENMWVDWTKFKECLDWGKMTEKVKNDMNNWQNILGVNWTPGNIIINNETWKWKLVSWAVPVWQLESIIDSLIWE